MPYAEKLLEMFQSTLPTRGSDTKPGLAVGNICVSIHAPHEGERPAARAITPAIAMFQSTLPTRGSDADFLACIQDTVWVSIHAPHEGERLALINHEIDGNGFNPRSPRGGATQY